MDPERTICHALPMQYLEDIQQMETWEREYELDDWRAFHIPRDGATSVYMNSVTTVSWSEEERAAKEALQERQLQDLEEPARKKRETADGHAVAIENAEVTAESDATADEPGAVDELGSVRDKDATAQQAERVKREPRSVLSKRQRRARRKLEQKKGVTKQQQDEEVGVEVEVKVAEDDDDTTAKDTEVEEKQPPIATSSNNDETAENNDGRVRQDDES
ncbi:MAG: hypothetical protein LQ341_007772 [Variospora aurantia]|nr:MAG: hypothetical protein LQ341_007772 [Variospora aurantia]